MRGKSLRARLAARASMLLAVAFVVFSIPMIAYAVNGSGRAFSDHTVPTVTPRGTTINLFDYWNSSTQGENLNWDTDEGINAGHQLHFNSGVSGNLLNSWTGNTGNPGGSHHGAPLAGMLENTLVNGYPSLNAQTMSGEANMEGGWRQVTTPVRSESLAYLFNSYDYRTSGANNVQGKAAYTDVQGLLQVDADGYYYYDSKDNFASFNEDTNSFTVYDAPAVTYGSEPNVTYGQFFPFNSAEDVFTEVGGNLDGGQTNAGSQDLNHYFGLSMTSRFVQRDGGTNNGQPVTYEFSGDDDVWIFIDGVLVADLGGIHDAVSVKIDFQTGRINVTAADGTDVTPSGMRTIKDCFQKAGRETSVQWSGNTFADNTYHTLNFYYLERGNNASNMNLKYNLVSVPESEIVKVDQDGTPVEGATYELYQANESYEKQGGAVYTGTTDANGRLVFTDANGFPIALEQLENASGNYVLVETTTPDGYRSADEVHLYFSGGNLLVDNEWGTGAYAQAKVTTTLPADTVYDADTGASVEVATGGRMTGTVFAVVMKRDMTKGFYDETAWSPVSGDAIEGWTVADGHTWDEVLAAARRNPYQLSVTSSGAIEGDIENIPGDVNKYLYQIKNSGGDETQAEYSISYYYTTATSIDGATADNTRRLDSNGERGHDEFDRTFSVRIYMSNIWNRLIVHKVDDAGSAMNGVEFALYNAADVTIEADGTAERPATQPVDTVTTGDLAGLGSGYAVFPSGNNELMAGDYVLLETSEPAGHEANKTAIRVTVNDEGVFAHAGTEGDGVSVSRGVGRVVRSMLQFAADDKVDATLHDVEATLLTNDSTDFVTADTAWTRTAESMHLQYDDAGTGAEDYIPAEGTGSTSSLSVESGWSSLSIRQCLDHDDDTESFKQDLGDQELSAVFSNSVTVTVENPRVGVDYAVAGGISVEKQLEGKDLTADNRFEFVLTAADAASAAKAGITSPDLSVTVQNEDASMVSGVATAPVPFDLAWQRFTADDAGVTYRYTLTETDTGVEGYTYDDTAYSIVIETAVDQQTGAVTVTTTVSDGLATEQYVYSTVDGASGDPATITFENSYTEPEPEPEPESEPTPDPGDDTPDDPGDGSTGSTPSEDLSHGNGDDDVLAATGDSTPLIIGGVAAVGVAALAIGVLARRARGLK